jgi:murein DD-endopeptidase MepM/ murein hydrolase activator NlpD
MRRLAYAFTLLLVAGSSAAIDDVPAAPSPDVRAAAAAPTPRGGSVGELERLLRSIEKEEQAANKRLDEVTREISLAHARSIVRGRAYVRLVRAGLLPVGGGFDALVEHATRLERLYRGLSSDLELERRLNVERQRLNEKLDALRARRAPLEVEQRLLADATAAVLAEEERRLAFESAFNASGNGAHAAVYGAAPGPHDPSALASDFASLRGRLPFPITGRSEIRSARRASSEGPGLEMKAPPGTVVRAVFAGRVAFADSYADYGNTVIIDHGARHYTVSSNLATVEVKVGDEVNAGERLGTVGGSPSALYFEVRVGKDTVDPAEWLGL